MVRRPLCGLAFTALTTCLVLAAAQAEEQPRPKIAVVQFRNRTEDVSSDPIGVGIAEMLCGMLSRVPSLDVLPTEDVWKALKAAGATPIGGRPEWGVRGGWGIALGQGVTDDWCFVATPPAPWLAKLCENTAAKVVVAGDYGRVLEGHRRLDLWIWRIAGGDTECALASPYAESTGDTVRLLPLVAEAVLKVGKLPYDQAGLERIAKYPLPPEPAFVEFSRGVASASRWRLGDGGEQQRSDALRGLNSAVSADQSFGLAYYHLGLVRRESNDAPGAKAALSRFIELETEGSLAAKAKSLLQQ